MYIKVASVLFLFFLPLATARSLSVIGLMGGGAHGATQDSRPALTLKSGDAEAAHACL